MRTATPYPSTSRIDLALDFYPLTVDFEAITTSPDESYQTLPFQSSSLRTSRSEDSFRPLPPFVIARPAVDHCGVCGDPLDTDDMLSTRNCHHTFCKSCLHSYVLVKIQERHYPISCPGCLADRHTSNYLEEDILYNLGIAPKETQILVDLQLSLHSRTVTCPNCKEITTMGRQDYFDNSVMTCSSSAGCAHKWCRDCEKEVGDKEIHHCKNKKLDRLMRRKGWKYCPGCRTPIQKETGCNHMTCGAPGCRVHFCYKCGDMIFDMSRSRSDGLSAAITTHYSRCRQYPLLSTYTLARAIPSRCSIQ
ncbi:hypothetical protein BDN70DRAFT_609099 [Pholiota conissans]|uniref:RING-type domain-containing protein n=1 Tax=Pholiota conissans TaxID=109636 RepID=A0A9P6CVB0_9AGAR|nr:hypothetical protein BDN70DRAFT_609099 [Pholiota conissans]